jgi:hypothetical protein
MRFAPGVALTMCLPALLAAQSLSQEDLAIIQDPGGWEYISITETNNGFKTDSVCFNEGQKGRCQGTLAFHTDGTYAQNVTVTPKSVNRQGKYEISGPAITLYDAFGTKDGPYTIALDKTAHTLTLETVQTGVISRIKLELESSYRVHNGNNRKTKQPG